MMALAAGAAALFPVQQAIAPGAIVDQAQTQTDAYREKTDRNRAIITDFVTILYQQRQPRAAFEKYVSEGYVQHNPIIADGRAVGAVSISSQTTGFNATQLAAQVRRTAQAISTEYAAVVAA